MAAVRPASAQRRALQPTSLRPPTLSAAVLTALALCSVLCLVWGGQAGAAVQRQLLAVLAGTLLGALALWWLLRRPDLAHCTLGFVLGLALLLRALSISAAPLLEDDHYRYLWDGLQTLRGLDPYRLPPAASFPGLHLAPVWQNVLSGINNPELTTLYGPVLQGLFAAGQLITPGRLGGQQIVLLCIDMGVLCTLAAQGVDRRWLLAYAVHPLVLREAMASAHPDGLLGLLLLLAVLAWQRQWALRLGLVLGLAVATKVAAWVAVPLLLLAPAARPLSHAGLTWVWRVAAALLAGLAVVYAPFVWVGGSDLASLRQFGQNWRFNPLLFRLLDGLLPASSARWAAALLLVAALGVLAWRWLRRAQAVGVLQPVQPCDLMSLAPPVPAALVWLLLLAPVVNPWYWLWALPVALLAGQRTARVVVVMGVVAVLSYVNSSVLRDAGWTLLTPASLPPYSVPWPLALAQLLALCTALWWDHVRMLSRPG